jgi:hypothetical protein
MTPLPSSHSIQILIDDAKWWLQETRKEALLPDIFSKLNIKIQLVKKSAFGKIEKQKIEKEVCLSKKGQSLQDYQFLDEAERIAKFVQGQPFGIRIKMKVSTHEKKNLMPYLMALSVGEKVPKEIKKVVAAWQLGHQISISSC